MGRKASDAMGLVGIQLVLGSAFGSF